MTNILCLIIGHSSKLYLQVTESCPTNSWMEDGMIINKKYHSFFLCKRCHESYKHTQIFLKENNNETS